MTLLDFRLTVLLIFLLGWKGLRAARAEAHSCSMIARIPTAWYPHLNPCCTTLSLVAAPLALVDVV
jgi:hypothetical protein